MYSVIGCDLANNIFGNMKNTERYTVRHRISRNGGFIGWQVHAAARRSVKNATKSAWMDKYNLFICAY